VTAGAAGDAPQKAPPRSIDDTEDFTMLADETESRKRHCEETDDLNRKRQKAPAVAEAASNASRGNNTETAEGGQQASGESEAQNAVITSTAVAAAADSNHMIASTDFGEELDDLLAYVYGFLTTPRKKHLIVSGPDPAERLAELNKFTHKGYCFGEEADGVTFYRDGDVHSLAAIPQGSCSAFVNNGPLTSASLDAVTKALKPCAVLYLVGSSRRGRVGGINQQYGDSCWQSFIETFSEESTVVDMPAEITRQVRFVNTPRIFPPDSHIHKVAARSVFMFFASRPCIPPKFAGLATHVRLNAGNAAVCNMWRTEAAIPCNVAAHALAFTKANQYIDTLKQMHIGGGGKGDSPETVAQQFALAGLVTTVEPHPDHIGVSLSELQWEKMRELACTCLEFTYDLGAIIQQESAERFPALYANEKFGFDPRKKMESNPDGAFVNSEVVNQYCKKAMEVLVTLTPAYDLLSALLASECQVGPLVQANVEVYQQMVANAMNNK